MTFVELQDDVLDRIGNSEPRARQRIKRALNEWHRRICAEVGLDYLLAPATSYMSFVAGTPAYELDAGVRKIYAITIPSLRVSLRETTFANIRELDPSRDTLGIPALYALQGLRTLHLYPIPDSTVTATIDGQGTIADLVADDAQPLIPSEFHHLLSIGALSREYEKVDDQRRFLTARKDLEAGIADLKHYVHTRALTGLRGGVAPPSRLGGWFPAGS